jgi:ArsR family transcriptional regulator
MNDFIPILKALADESRLQIINLLLTHDLCVGALASRLAISKPAVSQHLQILRKAGLVKGEKRGYWTHYSIERSMLHRIAEEIHRKADLLPFSQGVCQRAVSESTLLYDGRSNIDMCNDCCQHPEKLKGTPEGCTPEQIKECHGDTKDHPCLKGGHLDDSHS